MSKFPTIDDFEAVKGKLIHKRFGDIELNPGVPYFIDASTIGHLWIYDLIDKEGFDYITPILDYAIQSKSCLFEWNITDRMFKEIQSLYLGETTVPKLLINDNLDLKKYYSLLENAKTHRNEFNALSKLIVMLHKLDKVRYTKKTVQVIDYPKKGMLHFLRTTAPLINASYIGATQFYEDDQFEIPNEFHNILLNISKCDTNWKELRYYPIQSGITELISTVESFFIDYWYRFEQKQRLLFLKYIYNIRILQELSASLIGSNGLLSAISTRVIFDNFWQTKYLIESKEIEEYERHCEDRMRLYYAKEIQSDNSFDVFGVVLNRSIYDSIPLVADYFKSKGSVREICIKINVKDLYDKYYEFNSEFIHGSITGLYFGLLDTCNNKEHLEHLTINRTSSRHIDSFKDIFDIINMHGRLINDYLESDLLPEFDINTLTFESRNEFREFLSKVYKKK